MKRFLALMGALLPLLSGSSIRAAEETGLRVVCWNIRHGQGMDGKHDLERIAAKINELKPDVVLLQEVDNRCKRSGSVDQAEEIGKLTKLHHAFGKAINFNGGEYGQAILSRYPLTQLKVHPLPGGGEKRIAFSARIESPMGAVTVATVHLAYENPNTQLLQAQTVSAALLAESSLPLILAGDFNAVATSPTLAVFAQAPWEIVPKAGATNTFPADKPDREIDFLIVRGFRAKKPIEVVEDTVSSDHRPLVTILEAVR
jgi:endonuclease/exonuclease/phosphatase family metal-dependent hydrolase